MVRAFIWYVGGLVRLDTGSAAVGTSFCSLCHASAMDIQQWWSSIFEASLVGIERELGIVWWVYMQPRHSRASIWTKNHVKRAFSVFFIALNAIKNSSLTSGASRSATGALLVGGMQARRKSSLVVERSLLNIPCSNSTGDGLGLPYYPKSKFSRYL